MIDEDDGEGETRVFMPARKHPKPKKRLVTRQTTIRPFFFTITQRKGSPGKRKHGRGSISDTKAERSLRKESGAQPNIAAESVSAELLDNHQSAYSISFQQKLNDRHRSPAKEAPKEEQNVSYVLHKQTSSDEVPQRLSEQLRSHSAVDGHVSSRVGTDEESPLLNSSQTSRVQPSVDLHSNDSPIRYNYSSRSIRKERSIAGEKGSLRSFVSVLKTPPNVLATPIHRTPLGSGRQSPCKSYSPQKKPPQKSQSPQTSTPRKLRSTLRLSTHKSQSPHEQSLQKLQSAHGQASLMPRSPQRHPPFESQASQKQFPSKPQSPHENVLQTTPQLPVPSDSNFGEPSLIQTPKTIPSHKTTIQKKVVLDKMKCLSNDSTVTVSSTTRKRKQSRLDPMSGAAIKLKTSSVISNSGHQTNHVRKRMVTPNFQVDSDNDLGPANYISLKKSRIDQSYGTGIVVQDVSQQLVTVINSVSQGPSNNVNSSDMAPKSTFRANRSTVSAQKQPCPLFDENNSSSRFFSMHDADVQDKRLKKANPAATHKKKPSIRRKSLKLHEQQQQSSIEDDGMLRIRICQGSKKREKDSLLDLDIFLTTFNKVTEDVGNICDSQEKDDIVTAFRHSITRKICRMIPVINEYQKEYKEFNKVGRKFRRLRKRYYEDYCSYNVLSAKLEMLKTQ